jgi:hypothetical protein
VLGGKLYSMNEPWGYLLSSIIETLASWPFVKPGHLQLQSENQIDSGCPPPPYSIITFLIQFPYCFGWFSTMVSKIFLTISRIPSYRKTNRWCEDQSLEYHCKKYETKEHAWDSNKQLNYKHKI